MAVDTKKFPVEDELVFDGMTKILLGARPTEALNTLWDSGWLREVFPELERMARFRSRSKSKDLWKHVLQVVENCPTDPVFRWAALFHDVGKPVCYREKRGKVSFVGHEAKGAEIWQRVAKRMGTTKHFTECVTMIVKESGSFVELKNENLKGNLSDAAIRRYVKKTDGHLDNIFRFVLADMTTMWDRKLDKMRRDTRAFMKRIDELLVADYKESQKPKVPKKMGNLLMEQLDITGGLLLGKVMQGLTQKLVAGELTLESDFVSEGRKILDEVRKEEKKR